MYTGTMRTHCVHVCTYLVMHIVSTAANCLFLLLFTIMMMLSAIITVVVIITIIVMFIHIRIGNVCMCTHTHIYIYPDSSMMFPQLNFSRPKSQIRTEKTLKWGY